VTYVTRSYAKARTAASANTHAAAWRYGSYLWTNVKTVMLRKIKADVDGTASKIENNLENVSNSGSVFGGVLHHP
jgi:hypothetical protein